MASENFIFISYARTDEAFAVKLARDLRDKGVNVWIDQFDIYPGEKWDSTVQKALRSCGSIMVILSPASVASDNVQNEVAYAIKQERTVIPVLHEECDIPFNIVRLHYVDFTKDYERGFQEVSESVGAPQETAVHAKKKREDRINSLYREADAATANENWSAAKEKLQAILELQPNHSKAKAGFERVQEQMKLLAEEKELADLYSKGKEHLDARRFPKALEFFQTIQEIKADYKDVGALSTAAERDLRHDKKATRKPSQIKPSTPPPKNILQQRGAILIGSGFLLSLIVVTYMVFETDLFKKGPLVENVSNDSLFESYMQQGDTFFIQRQYRKANAKFEKAVNLKPDNNDAKNKLAASDSEIRYADAVEEGKKRFNRGDFAGAKSSFQTALFTKSNDPFASEKLKQCNDKISQQEAEQQRLRQFTKYKNEGETYLKQGKYAQAKQKFRTALTYKSEDSFVLGRIKECDRLLAKPKEIRGMASIPAGTFLMGSEEGYVAEKPVHKVYVDAFYMDKTEVTVEQYAKFINATNHGKPANWTEQLQQPKHPVVYVSWENAMTYAKWAGKRLPTEAEWEYAARGDNNGLDGKPKYKYPWGDEIDKSKANYANPRSDDWAEGPKKYLKNVGSYSSNKYELYDMAGNVWEWCADWYDDSYYQNFKNKTAQNPKGPETGIYRVLRSGSWFSPSNLQRCAVRVEGTPTVKDNYIGFRCVQDVR